MHTDQQIVADALHPYLDHDRDEAASAVVDALTRAARLRPAPTVDQSPDHGPGSLPHGYDGTCGDYCDNRQCPAGLYHDRCTPTCTSEVTP